MATLASEIDLSALAFWQQPRAVQDEAFAVLRREAPISWQRAPETSVEVNLEYVRPYWAVVTHEDVRTVSRDPATFCSGEGVLFEGAHPDLLEASQSFLQMDAPRHTKVRGLVNAAFTPRQVARIEQDIARNAKRVVDDLAALGGECDFVEHVAKRLPMMTIFDMIGVPEADRERLREAADVLVSFNDPDFLAQGDMTEQVFNALLEATAGALEMADHRAEHPGDDLMSALVHTEVDGERLLPEEISAFFVLLSVAGNDTTRHTTSLAMQALTEHPDQRALLLDSLNERLPAAVEEFVRWASAVMTFARTATRDTELSGQPIAAGEKVVMFYRSANFDERAFEHPERFELSRSPNHHVGFGGGGPHYCMGASLARTQLRSIFGELLARIPDIETGEPEPLVGNFVNGIKRMPCRFTSP